MPIKIPVNIFNKKLPLISLQKLIIPLLFKIFKDDIEIFDKLRINSSYIPRTKAIVPPETPGTRSAMPIKTPLRIRDIDFMN